MTRHVHITIKKCLFLTLFIVGGALLSGCSKVGISDLSTLAGPGQSQAQLSSLKSFALLPLDHENPFSEQLALDTVRDNLLARGFRLEEHSPDFLVAVWADRSYQAEERLNPAYPMPFGWYRPVFGAYAQQWPGHGGYARSGRYTVISNYVAMTIAFLNPAANKKIKENQETPDLENAVPAGDILWLGQAHAKSSRGAFTTLSCLAAGILEEFPNSGQKDSKSVELNRCN